MIPKLTIDVFPKKFRKSKQFEEVADLAVAVDELGVSIRKRVQGRGLNARGNAFGEHRDTLTPVPIRRPGPLRKGQAAADREIIAHRTRFWKTWIRPADGYPTPRRYFYKSPGGKYLVDYATYMQDIHGDRRFRFSVSGSAWAALAMSFNRGKKTATSVRLYFRGSGPSLRGRGGEQFPNRDKMRLAQARVGQPILEPSQQEQDHFAERMEGNVQRWLAALLPPT